MKCPSPDCDFSNPPDAVYCECGYHFESKIASSKKCPNLNCSFTSSPETIYCECGYHFKDILAPTKRCPTPGCDFLSPLEALRCDCGYEFVKEAPSEKDLLRCPGCDSTQLTANKQGYGWKKGLGIAVCTGPIGVLAGFINSKKIWVTCLKCGHKWKAGEN